MSLGVLLLQLGYVHGCSRVHHGIWVYFVTTKFRAKMQSGARRYMGCFILQLNSVYRYSQVLVYRCSQVRVYRCSQVHKGV